MATLSISDQFTKQIDQAKERHERLSARLKRQLAETEVLIQRCQEILGTEEEEEELPLWKLNID